MVEVTSSTQDDIAQLVSEKKVQTGQVIASEYQSAGRGRLDRKFDAAPNSALMFSFFVKPRKDKSEWSFLTLLTGLTAVFTLKNLDPASAPQLKWPNDLEMNSGKLGGIIAQATGDGVILGVGINVGMERSELPVSHATSLAINEFAILDRNLILATFLTIFEELFERWQDGEDLRHLYAEYSSTLGREIRIELPDGGHKIGNAVGVTPLGELVLKDGSRVTVGDVVHLR